MDNMYDEVCAKCGLTLGSHRGDSIINNQCPKTQGYMDWPEPAKEERVTIFQHTGKYSRVPDGTKSKYFGG